MWFSFSFSTRVGEAWKYDGENAVLEYECTVDWETHKLLDAAVVIYIKVSWNSCEMVECAVRLVLAHGENKQWLYGAVQILSGCFKSVLFDFPSCSVSVGRLTHLSGLWLVVQHLPKSLTGGMCFYSTRTVSSCAFTFLALSRHSCQNVKQRNICFQMEFLQTIWINKDCLSAYL